MPPATEHQQVTRPKFNPRGFRLMDDTQQHGEVRWLVRNGKPVSASGANAITRALSQPPSGRGVAKAYVSAGPS